ncbi:MAG: acyl-CoA dehydrogenase [Planctomycetes bacterium]|nr:acyl-CoA dehydrogenase [Planctomycetota bacterium]
MPNFFEDNEDIKFHLDTMDLEEIVRLQEKDFTEAAQYPFAPTDCADAMDSYRRVLSMVGDIAGNFVAPRAADVDEEGTHFENGKVTYAKGIAESIEMLSKADLMGFTLPRKYGGLNLPTTIYSVAIEMISRADASLMNIFGLQDIAETIHSFASDEIKDAYLPMFCTGEVTGAMVLTEPDAGSDLQAVRLTATEDADNGVWRLNGVKRFITNGCGEVLLVLARSEAGTTDGRGLSLFLCESKDGVRVRRIEHKMGITGSPTCELQFNNVPAKLIGKRKRGLITYVMALMNGARIGIAGQALGIAQAAYNEAVVYAREREQFGKKIKDIPAVAEMLVNMKVHIEAARALLYETSRFVDLEENLNERVEAGEKDPALKQRLGPVRKLAAALTPMSKYFACEMAVKVCYDAQQVHGGSGYMKDYNIERHYRDVRITSIYEGTSQLQAIAILAGLQGGALDARLEEFASREYDPSLRDLVEKTKKARELLRNALDHVREKKDQDFTDLSTGRLADIVCDVYMSYLLLSDAEKADRKKVVARKFISDMLPRVEMNAAQVLSGERVVLDSFEVLVEADAPDEE